MGGSPFNVSSFIYELLIGTLTKYQTEQIGTACQEYFSTIASLHRENENNYLIFINKFFVT